MALSDVIPVGDVPSFVAASPSGTHLYVTNQRSNTVSVIETSTVYVTNLNSDTVSVIDTAANAAATTIAVGDTPVGVAVTPDGRLAYVTNFL